MRDAILLLEDNEGVITGFSEWMEESPIDADLIICRTYDEYERELSNATTKSRIKCMIMDLSNNPVEDQGKEFKSTDYIKKEYESNRIPLFVHSANLVNFEYFDDSGTVFKIEKGTSSTIEIGEKIELMYESGFIHIFCCGGILEESIMNKIHSSFIEQFKGNEIENIIKSIKSADESNFSTRTNEVFERLALRAVYQNSISNREGQQSVKVNSIEHYYRRTNRASFPFWTGDVFELPAIADRSAELVVIVTPRCNAANCNYEQILVCTIKSLDEESLKKIRNPKKDIQDGTVGEKALRKNITDDATSERHRFLPMTPQFVGGIVDFVKCYSIPAEKLEAEFYKISLVDDLTNDVIRKLATYLLRGGISDTAYKEAHFYFQEEQQKVNPPKN